MTDLQVKVVNSTAVMMSFTSPGDDLDSQKPVTRYIIKYDTVRENLTQTFDSIQTEINVDDLVGNSSLDPVDGTLTKTLYFKY